MLHHDEQLVKDGFAIAWRNGFKHIPPLEEIASLDPLWIADILRMAEEVDRQMAHLEQPPIPEQK